MKHAKVLAIRADAGEKTGTGHVMRTLALAQAWIRSGGEVIVITRSMPQALAERLRSEGIPIHTISGEPGGEEDLLGTASIVHAENAQWLIVDGYTFHEEYFRSLRNTGIRVLMIDDYGQCGHYHADIVLNPGIGATGMMYRSREPATSLLLGPAYTLIREEFLRARESGPKRNGTPPVRLVVTLGGSDPDNVTGTVIRGLDRQHFPGISVTVVIGPANPHTGVLDDAVRASGGRIRLVRDPADLAAILSGADIAICAAGNTAMELAFLGIPMVILVLAENQEMNAGFLSAEGCALTIGRGATATPEQIGAAVRLLLADERKRDRMAACCGSLIDGKGADRVVERLLSGAIYFREMEESDCDIVWEWANDPETRQNSFSTAPIPRHEHRAWFATRLQNRSCRDLILLGADLQPTGLVRFDIDGEDATISINIAKSNRHTGLGRTAIRRACNELFASSGVTAIHAYMRPENSASIRAFTHAGFMDLGKAMVRNTCAVHMVLKKT